MVLVSPEPKVFAVIGTAMGVGRQSAPALAFGFGETNLGGALAASRRASRQDFVNGRAVASVALAPHPGVPRMAQEYRPTLKTWFSPTVEVRAANRRLFFSFRGRSGRQAYWRFAAGPALAFTALTALLDLPARRGAFGFTVFGLLPCWVVLAVSVKRCHDRGRSGWFMLANLIPLVGSLWVLVELGFLPAAAAGDRYETVNPGEPFVDAAEG